MAENRNKDSRQKIRKGDFGYLKKQKRNTVLRTVLFFVLSLSIFVIGYVTTGSRKNLLTIVAVLGMLPASKSAVNMIMFLKAKNCSEQLYHRTLEHTGGLIALFELVLTSYDKNFSISSLVVLRNEVVGFSEFTGCDTAAAEKHINTMLKKNSFTKMTVKIFDSAEKFWNRLDQLKEKQEEKGPEDTEGMAGREEEVAELIRQIAL